MSYCIDDEMTYWGGLQTLKKGYERNLSMYNSCGIRPPLFEVNKQMCDLEIDRNKWDKIGKEWDSKKDEIVLSIFKGIENQIKERDMEEKKTKKMTKAEAFEWLKGKKVYANGKGKEVQTKLFECGVGWAVNHFVYYDFGDYLLIETDGCLFHCGYEGDIYWRAHHFKEISVDDILSIEIIDENRSEDELVEIVELGKKIQSLLSKISGHRHVVITEDDVLLYDEGMCLFHSDPF